ncbi:MAG: hypothetical protein KDB82_15240, partial [Planctomycetes bacterium]|nr:hypothetical protein [Planctomycetota bacterium]
AYRDGRMVGAYSYSTAELIARFVRKNRAAVSITLLALLLLIGGGVYAYTTVKAQRDAALAAEADALQQRTLADQQAAEAKRQKGIAEDEAAEAERQKGIAQTAAKDAADARDDAKLQAAEAERQQKIAELSARRAELSAQAAEAAEARANNALDEARSNLAQAHLGYAQLAKERNQPGEQIVHLAAAHAADDKVVSVDRLVSTLHQTVFPVWSTRSYVDLPADVASFTPDCRLCAAPLHEAPKGMDELDTTGDNVELPDIGIWDVASGTLLRRIKTGSHIQRRLLLNADGTRLAALDATGKLQLWDVTSGDEISNRSLFDWTDVPLIVPGAGRETFFTATPAGNINEWHFADGTPGRSVKAEDEPNSLAASPDGVHVAVSNWLGTVAVWELGSDQPPVRKALDESSKLVGFGPDGPLISHKTEVMFDDVIDIQLWDMKLENQLRTFPTRSWQISSVAVNQAGTHLAAGLYGGGWKLYDYTTGNVVQQRGKSGGNVVAVSFAPDGESLVLAQKGEGFDVLKIGGDPLVSRSPDHTLGSMSVQFSPDGKYFASAGFDGRVLLRNATDGSSVWALTVSESRLLRTAFSPDGSTLAAYSADQVISFVDVSSGRLKQSLSLGIYSYGMKFTPDGQYLTAPTRDGPIHLIDPTTAKIAKTVTLDNGEYVISLNCDPNSNRLYMLDHYMTLWAWNWDDGRPAARLGQLSFGTEANVTKSIYNSTIGPDGHSLIISVGDGSILGCTPEPFAQLFTAQIGAGPIVNSAFGRSSGFIVCGTGDGILCFVDANTGEVVKKQRAHDAAIVAVAVSPDGRNIVTSAVDGEFRSWSAPAFMYSEQRRIGVVRAGTPALSPDGKLLAAGVDSNMIRVIDVASGDTVDEFTIEGNYVAGLKFTPDNRGLVASLSPGRLLIRNLADGATRRFALNDGAGGIDFDDEGHLLVVGLYYGLQVRDLATGELVRTVPKTTGFYQVSALPGGKTVLLTGSLDEPRIVNLADGETIATLERGGYGTNASCVSPDGETLAIVRDVGLIGLHRVTDGKRLRNLKVRNTNIQAVEFLPQKDRLFYLTGDGVGVVVDINSGQELLETWFPYSYTVGGMLLPDGSQALAVGSGGVYELWNLAPQLDRLQSLSNLSVEQLEALTQILAGMKLERLNALHLPRRTGNISWLTPDGQPPAFLAGDLPAWVPRLDGKDIAEARTYLQKLNDTRNAGIDAFAMSWQDGFEGYRYREELQPDLTVERVKVPEREKDANGNYIGEPVGEIDFVAWLTDHRKVTDAARQERVKHYAELEGKAAADGDWELARVYCEVLKALEPTKLDWIIEYCRASLGIQSYWMPTWTLEMNIGRATPEQKPEMLLLWARMMSTSGNLQGMLERFDAARDAGYIADDWHLYRARALEESGAFKQAVAAGERGVAECKDASVVTELLLLRARCLAWLSISKGIDDLPRVAITLVTEGSEAERAGLKAGDLLLGFKAGEEERLTTDAYGQIALDSDWKNFLDTAAPEIQTATLKVRRDGVEIEIEYPRKPFDFGRFTLRPPRE